MPRPHYPVQGGAHPLPVYGSGRVADGSGECVQCGEKSSEIDRLRSELAQARKGTDREEGQPRMAASAMMWAALGVCGTALMFALAAMLHHG